MAQAVFLPSPERIPEAMHSAGHDEPLPLDAPRKSQSALAMPLAHVNTSR
ncbi:MAG: hypothetical protein M1294_05820 [Firmicutes bacterium]|nr:hypothetical protein [Bacillota bacterium]